MSWMDFLNGLISCLAWAGLVCSAVRLAVLPFLIGKKRDDVSAADCAANVITWPLTLLTCGRLLGWW